MNNLQNVLLALENHHWVGVVHASKLYEVRLINLSDFIFSYHKNMRNAEFVTNNTQDIYEIRITGATGTKYYIDNYGYVLSKLRKCVHIEEILQCDWTLILPQPIAEEMFPKTIWHLQTFYRVILLASYIRQGYHWRKKREIIRIYIVFFTRRKPS